MSWFDASNFTSLAKTALSQAQKSIDKVLDIEQTDGEVNATSKVSVAGTKPKDRPLQKEPSHIQKPSPTFTHESPNKAAANTRSNKVEEDSLWSSFLDEKSTSPKKGKSTGQRTHRSSKLGARRQNSRGEETKQLKQREDVTSGNAMGACGKNKTKSTDESRPGTEGWEAGLLLRESETGCSKKADDIKTAELPTKVTDKMDSEVSILDSIQETRAHKKVQELHIGSDEANMSLPGLNFSSECKPETDNIESEIHSGDETLQPLAREEEASSHGQEHKSDGNCENAHDLLLQKQLRNTSEEEFDVHVSQGEPKSTSIANDVLQEELKERDSVEGFSAKESEPTKYDKSAGDGVFTGAKLEERDLIPDEVDEMTDSAAQIEHHLTDSTEVLQGELGKELELGNREDHGKVTMETESLQNANSSGMHESLHSSPSDTEEIANLQQVLQVRESKLVVLSKENMDLQETNSILRNQLAQLEEIQRADDAELEELRQEFTTRVAATESKFHLAAKERDQLKKTLEEKEKSFSALNSKHQEEYTTVLAEKDEQITQLLEEGEKLSKQQLQSNNIIKKLRAKEKESDTLIKNQSKKLEELEAEVAQLREVMKVKSDSEKVQEEGILKQNAYVKKQEELLSKQKSELDDANEKIRSMQTALDNAYKELTELHKEMASEESKAQASVLSTEMAAKEELRIALERCRKDYAQEEEVMALQITDLRTSLSRSEQQSARREDNLRQEISDLQQRLQEAEARNQELTESVTLATRPLLRQIENLQNTYSGQAATLEKVEKSLTDRLNDAQVALAFAQEKERATTEHALELNSRVSTLESQLATHRQDKSRLEALLEMERSRFETAEEGRSRETARLDALHTKYKKIIEDANIEKTLLEQQLAVEKGKLETEKARMQTLLEEKSKLLVRQSSFNEVAPSPPAQNDAVNQKESTVSPSYKSHVRQSSANSGVLDGLSRSMMGAGTALVERLQAQVKQKDGEIELLQDDIAVLEKSRDAVTQELASLTLKLEDYERDKVALEKLQIHHQELQQRYNAVLQMYGEKEEETEELKLDLEDVKSMYKAQIEELLRTSSW